MSIEQLAIKIELLSPTLPGSGLGTAGLVDAQPKHRDGIPYIAGRTVKGLLVDECRLILSSLRADEEIYPLAEKEACRLFGIAGSSVDDQGMLHVGDASLDPTISRALEYMLTRKPDEGGISSAELLQSLTLIRRQTSIDPETGAPSKTTLRAFRLLKPRLVFFAPIYISSQGDPAHHVRLSLLAACARGLKRMGTSRNRGAGRVNCHLVVQTGDGLDHFDYSGLVEALKGGSA